MVFAGGWVGIPVVGTPWLGVVLGGAAAGEYTGLTSVGVPMEGVEFVVGCNELMYIGEVDDDPFTDLLPSTKEISFDDPLSLVDPVPVVVPFAFVDPFSFIWLDPSTVDNDPFVLLDPTIGNMLVEADLLI